MDQQTQSIKKLHYSIGEVSKVAELKQYVLRYWETEFKQLSPSKNKAGNRTYRQKDIDLILRIKDLLYIKKFTIEGARNMLNKEGSLEDASLVEDSSNTIDIDLMIKIRSELKSIIEDLHK